METLRSIYYLLQEFKQKKELLVAKDKTSYDAELKSLKDATKEKFNNLRDLMPDLLQINYPASITKADAKYAMECLKEKVAGRISADNIASGECFHDQIDDTAFDTPALLRWQNSKQGQNFVINYSNDTKSRADECMNNLIMNIVLSLPIKSVHLSFVDLNFSGAAQMFTKNLDKSLYSDLIVSSREFDDYIEKANSRMVKILQEYGELVKYNHEKGSLQETYEIITLLDYPNKYSIDTERISSLFENGYKGGIYFIVMHNTDHDNKEDDKKSLIDYKNSYQLIDINKCKYLKNAFIAMTPVVNNATLRQCAFEYINAEATRVEKKVLKAQYEEIATKSYENAVGDISVPVGETESGEEVLFRMSTVGHVHSFILGQSGSGKSVFLHNVITGAISKYSPSDLNLYLLDFKLGGVEFNRYKGEKHVKGLLVDNSDIQITLEILRNISDQMKERGRMLRASGVSNLTDYNKAHPTEKMPQILLVADECHVMFNPQGRKNLKQYNEISEIIVKIAKEGRSQGVHLVLATQTLAQTEISSEILNNISDHYLLKCAPADSEKMVRDSSEITSGLSVGQVYYHSIDEQKVFQAYFVPTEEGIALVKKVNEKNAGYNTDKQFYFAGSQVFTIDDSVKSIINNETKDSIVASVGRSIDVQQKSVNIPLRNDFGENILLFGIDDEEQVTGTTMAIIRSMHYSSKVGNLNYQFKVMDFLGKENGNYKGVLKEISREGNVEIVDKNDYGTILLDLAQNVKKGSANPTILVLIAQERFRDLKFDNEIGVNQEENNEPSDDFGFGGSFTSESSSTSDLNTYRKALTYLLDNGADKGVHVILQLDKPEKLLFEEYVTGKLVFEKFRHLIMLRSEENAINRLNLNDDIALENLSSDPERLRAFYYNETNDSYTLFTPYK
ncbi:FtsK/SpoIIIE domain-containing protein [Segatella baroniae]|jgi:hypothetical protein|uniref:FtsK/SpoIIIE domain-containing protein n=1 Tax=Segatella baroniae TaxID=305719 RepID=UPI000418AA35|nr:FtsK/SpoIIIE domain-containing protein [Segatella baroniae]